MKLKLVFSKLYNQMTHLPAKHMSKLSENINRTLYMFLLAFPQRAFILKRKTKELAVSWDWLD